MILLIRIILVTMIIYLLVKSFIRYFSSQEDEARKGENQFKSHNRAKGVSKEVGEYIDYEEIDKKN